MARPVLRAGPLTLRPARADDDADVGAFHAMLADPRVAEFLCDGRILSRSDAARILREDGAAHAAQGLGLWLAVEGARAVGAVGLKPVGARTTTDPAMLGAVEPVVAFEPAVWGRGLATAALGALLGHADGALRLARTVAIADAPNLRSRRVLGRVGYREIGGGPGAAHPLIFFERIARAQPSGK
jgi:RimJ/RimL family protein N-acetyltransferase